MSKGSHCGHFPVRKGKIKNIQVLHHPLLMDGFWNGRDPPLEMPPQDHLSSGFFVALCDFFQNLIVENIFLSF